MAELQRQLGLDVAILEEYQETQQSLYPVLLVGGRKKAAASWHGWEGLHMHAKCRCLPLFALRENQHGQISPAACLRSAPTLIWHRQMGQLAR